MPFDPDRLKSLRRLKRLTQKELADQATGITQSQICDCEKKGTHRTDIVERLADALDCTTDFLLGRGVVVDFHATASRMAFDVFAARLDVSEIARARCRRVLGHSRAPVTVPGWVALAEQIELAIGPSDHVTRFRRVSGE